MDRHPYLSRLLRAHARTVVVGWLVCACTKRWREGGQYWSQDGHLSKRTSAGRTTFIFVRYVCVGYRMYSVKNKSNLKFQTGRKVIQTLIWEKAEDLPSKEQLLKARKHLLNPEENETSKSAQNLRFDDFAVFEVQDSTSTNAHTHQTILTQGLQKSWPFTSNISALVKMQISGLIH